VRDEARTAPAANDARVERGKRRGRLQNAGIVTR
jgi:hypothetical protein